MPPPALLPPPELLPPPRAALNGDTSGSSRAGRGADGAGPTSQRSDRCQIPDCTGPSLAHLRPYNRRTRRGRALLLRLQPTG